MLTCGSFSPTKAHLGIIRDSCPPQDTAIKKYFSVSQNFLIDLTSLVFNAMVNIPIGIFICLRARSICGLLSVKGYQMLSTFAEFSRNSMTFKVVSEDCFSLIGNVRRLRSISHAFCGARMLPKVINSL